MTDTQIIQKAIEELETPSLGTTKQLLEVHKVLYQDSRPKVLRVTPERKNGTAAVYFAIEGERFFLTVYLDIASEISVIGVDTLPYHSVYFRATSETLNFEQLSELTTLKPTSGWSKGDTNKSGKVLYKFSSFEIKPNPEPDEFEDKIKKLLDILEQDKEGVLHLTQVADGIIQIHSCFHNGNTMLGGHHLNRETINRLAALNLAVDFDIYAEGNFFLN